MSGGILCRLQVRGQERRGGYRSKRNVQRFGVTIPGFSVSPSPAMRSSMRWMTIRSNEEVGGEDSASRLVDATQAKRDGFTGCCNWETKSRTDNESSQTRGNRRGLDLAVLMMKDGRGDPQAIKDLVKIKERRRDTKEKKKRKERKKRNAKKRKIEERRK